MRRILLTGATSAIAEHAARAFASDGDALVRRLGDGPTNAGHAGRDIRETVTRAQYDTFFAALPDLGGQ